MERGWYITALVIGPGCECACVRVCSVICEWNTDKREGLSIEGQPPACRGYIGNKFEQVREGPLWVGQGVPKWTSLNKSLFGHMRTPLNRQTDMTENITFPHSTAGCNNGFGHRPFNTRHIVNLPLRSIHLCGEWGQFNVIFSCQKKKIKGSIHRDQKTAKTKSTAWVLPQFNVKSTLVKLFLTDVALSPSPWHSHSVSAVGMALTFKHSAFHSLIIQL